MQADVSFGINGKCNTDFLQGIPVGLAFGTMPFLLKAKLSYSDIGIFGLCTYPYSLKLLWSPFVDSVYLRSLFVK